MTTMDAKHRPALGFLTVVEHPQHGLFGGYLLLNLAARPLEFHCTTPIKANRAQEILYGPTLEAYLYGEQIGSTLLGQSKIEPLAVFTDRPPVLAVRSLVSFPVALVMASEESANGHLFTFRLGGNALAAAEKAEGDATLIAQRLAELSESFDLAEPFERIRQAIEEAQQAAR